MSENKQTKVPKSVSDWTRDTFDKAVRELIANNLIDVEVIEARPFWTMENTIVIGQIREANEPTVFWWVICGDLPTDHISSEVAATPQDVARYFAMKWQLDAEKQSDSSESARLTQKAEELFELTEIEDIWQ